MISILFKKYLVSLNLLLLLIFSSCANVEVPEYSNQQELLEERDSSGRRRAEYLEDFDYLLSVLEDNFPFFDVIYRRNAIDIRELHASTRNVLENNNHIYNDEIFFHIMNALFFSPIGGLGHLSMLSRSFYHMHIVAFEYFIDNLEDLGRPFEAHLQVLNDPRSREFYGDLHNSENLPTFINYNNVEVDILQEGKIAYIRIDSFNHLNLEHDREIIFNFYEEIANYEHLIIDITRNSGGSSQYFWELVLSPNIVEPLQFQAYFLMKSGENNLKLTAPMVYALYAESARIFEPINDMVINDWPYINKYDLESLDLFFRLENTIYPTGYKKAFNGKIWLLASGANFSASEYVAALVKQTGFATLVGETTGGNGIGVQPAFFVLPNTGIIVRYASIYGIDLYGRNNQEFGTDPHVFNHPAKDAVQTVLALIEEGYYR